MKTEQGIKLNQIYKKVAEHVLLPSQYLFTGKYLLPRHNVQENNYS